MWFCMQPYSSAARGELRCVFQEIGDDALHLGRVEGKGRQLVIGEEVQRQSFGLKSLRPQAADFRETDVQVAGLELHPELSGFENRVIQEVFDEMLQALSAGMHIVEHAALLVVERTQFSAAKQFDVPIENSERSLQVVSGGG